MIKVIVIYCIVLFHSNYSSVVSAQANNDYVWILGYPPNNPHNHLGGVILDFNNNIVTPEYFSTKCWASEPAVWASSSGKLLAYSNGCNIYNADHEIMLGGDSLSYGDIWDNYCDYGYPGTQHNLILPWPGDSTKAIVFHVKVNDDFLTHQLLYSIIKLTPEFPLGIVIEKNSLLLSPGQSSLVTATRHGNGRDWWIVFPEDSSNRFFKILIDQDNVAVVDTQSIGIPWGVNYSKSQAIFTPDGTKYIRFNPWKGLDIFEFDRCSGDLSNPIESGPLSDPLLEAGGVASSADSRFVYVTKIKFLYQFDLWADDILGSKMLIDEYDGYQDPLSTTFYHLALGPDGKIYGFATNTPRSLHIIHHPEQQGNLCTFVQHDMELPAFVDIGSINMVNFRLGPEDGSICDTLNIDNIPVADFRFEIDSLNPFIVHFTNLSYFMPETYYWNFGESLTSSFKDPSNVDYISAGTYEVCLSVSNEYGQDIFCRTIVLQDSFTSARPLHLEPKIRVYPNPFQAELYIDVPQIYEKVTLSISSTIGLKMLSIEVNSGLEIIPVSNWPQGVYFYSITRNEKKLKSGYLSKL